MTRLFPVALRLEDKPCLVVGGGAVGTRRVFALRDCGAQVTVVAPQFTVQLHERAQTDGSLRLVPEPFQPRDLQGMFLVIAATNDAQVNKAVASAARERGVLLNLAAESEDAETGDFDTMAAIRRGDLLFAVTTGGSGPALTARLRRELETLFPPIWSEYVAFIKRMRSTAKNQLTDTKTRTEFQRRLVEDVDIFQAILSGDTADAERRAERLLSSILGKDAS